ncbi:putative F-box protein At3g23970 [Fagus crenata]
MAEFLTDDLVIENLVRLPVKSLYDFKSVSKRWYEIISGSYFLKLYIKREFTPSLLGFFVSDDSESEHAIFKFLPTSDTNSANSTSSTRSSKSDDERFESHPGCSFIGCSNGMMLYGNHYTRNYFVWNPIKKKIEISFPQPHNTHSCVAIGFHFDVLNHKFVLVRAGLSDSPTTTYSSSRHMETISSNTLQWQNSVLGNFVFNFLMRPFEYAVKVKGNFQWLGLENSLVSYNYDNGFCIPIRLPISDLHEDQERSSILGVTKDEKLQFGRSNCFGIKIWFLEDVVLENGRKIITWIVTHHVSFMFPHDWYPDILRCHEFCYYECDHDDLILNEDILQKNLVDILQEERSAHVPLLVAFHSPNIVFLRLGNRIMSYCLDHQRSQDQRKLELVLLQGNNTDIIPSSRKYFPYFTPIWAASYLQNF